MSKQLANRLRVGRRLGRRIALLGFLLSLRLLSLLLQSLPSRLKRWILIWTPIVSLVLELATYPKDRPVSSGFSNVIGGFFSDSIAAYPAWIVLALGVIVLALGVVSLLRRQIE